LLGFYAPTITEETRARGLDETMNWREFEAAAPELAALGRERFEATGVALLGTLRADGSPRINPVEPYLAAGHLLLGLLTWSRKARDLVRDPRCTVHSSVSDVEGTEGEFKLYGRAREVRDDRVRAAPEKAWWRSRPVADARVYSLAIDAAAFVSWNAEEAEMTVRRWSPQRGLTVTTRTYP
jgi:Pyridoxamine 5'-phosphate oxidase